MIYLRNNGVISYSNAFNKENYPTPISDHVIGKALAHYGDCIKNSERFKKSDIWTGPKPDVVIDSKIHVYLRGYSIRKGVTGKLTGLLFRIIQSLSHVMLRKSDKRAALKEIQNLMHQVEEINNETFEKKIPNHIKLESKIILKQMLASYNEIVLKEQEVQSTS